VRIRALEANLKPYYTQIKNFGYLTLLQVFNMALPLLTYPYLVKVLGPETYGMVIYSQAIMGYLVVFVNFGFNSTATREISVYRSDSEKISEIVSSVYIIKGILFSISALILFITLSFLNLSRDFTLLFYLTLWMCLYEFLFPLWYFQGTEKMKYITFITLFSRILFLIFIFLLVKGKGDYLLVPVINGVGSVISCIIAIRILGQNSVKLKIQSFRTIKFYVEQSYVMAISYGANVVKTNLNLIVAKHFFSFSEVVFVDIALKITNIATTFLDMISQAVFPQMSVLKDKKLFSKIMNVALFVSMILMIAIQLFASKLVGVLGGSTITIDEAVKLTRIFALNLPIYISGALLGRNCLLIYGYDKKILQSMVYSAIVYISLLILGSRLMPSLNLSVFGFIYLISFLFETLYRFHACKTNNLLK
jgi:PST family polysaccharide transporter